MKKLLKFYPGKNIYTGISLHLAHTNAFFFGFIGTGLTKDSHSLMLSPRVIYRVIYTSLLPYSPSVGEEAVDEIERKFKFINLINLMIYLATIRQPFF